MSRKAKPRIETYDVEVRARRGRYLETKEEPDWSPWGPHLLHIVRVAGVVVCVSPLRRGDVPLTWAEYDPRIQLTGCTFEAEGWYFEVAPEDLDKVGGPR